MVLPAELLALATAITMAIAGMLMAGLAGRVSPVAVTRTSMIFATLFSLGVAVPLGGLATIDRASFHLLSLSGFLSIIVAGPCYYGSMFTIGPRNSILLFSLNAPIATALGMALLGEELKVQEAAGIAVICAGVILAVLFGSPRDEGDQRLIDRFSPTGVLLGVIAAIGQATGNLAAQPAMAAGTEPFTAMAVRSGIGAIAFTALVLLPLGPAGDRAPIARRDLATIVLSTLIGMGIGMTMMMEALRTGNVGIVSTLTATTPVAVLPLVWMKTGRRPSWQAWLGALLAVAGTALLFLD